MTAFAAIFDRRRRPLDRATLDSVGRALATVVGASEDPLVSGSRGFAWVDRTQPPSLPDTCCRGAEALDRKRLVESWALDPICSLDAALMAGIERFGSDMWSRIEGCFGIALFEPRRHALYLGRDPLGGRTLFFLESGDLVLVSDRIETLLACSRASPSLDSAQLARFFGLEPPRAGRTCFRGIREVEPGCAVEISEQGLRHHRFWTPEPDAKTARATDAEFARRFRTLLRRETSKFADVPERLGVMLSGGIDSTSLAVLAARQAEGRPARPAACSWLFDELGSCDERVFIDETLAAEDFEVIQIRGDGCWPLVDPDLFSSLPGAPEENPFRALKRALYSAARERGRRLLLNGGAADIFYRGAGLYLRDLLRAGRWGTATRSLVHQVREAGWRPAAGAVARTLRPTGRRKAKRPAPGWLTDVARARWAEELDAGSGLDRGPRDVVPYLAMESRGLAIENLYAAQSGVRVASPYWTRGWVDFMLSLPADQVFRPGTTKFVARAAMRGIIPESIRTRQRPTLLNPLFDRGIFEREANVVQDLLHGGTPVWKDFVDPAVIAGVGPNSTSTNKLLLWQCVSFELWRRRHGWEVG